jgi:hypothetical protein
MVFFVMPHGYLDGFLKDRIIKALGDAYPEYSIRIAGLQYRIMENRLECDSIDLTKIDSTFSCSIARFSVTGIDRMQLLWGGGVAPDNLVSSRAWAEDILLTFHRTQYEVCCDRLRISVPDSEIVVEALDLHPLANDDEFFARSRFSQTRFHLVVPHFRVMGSACLSLLEGNIQCARIAQIQDASLDVLINKDKPSARDSLPPVMPNELLSSIIKTVHLDSVQVINGRLNYGEKYPGTSKPARLTFDGMQVLAEGPVDDRIGHLDTVVVRAEGRLMNAGTMHVVMLIPVASPEFTFRYSGSLDGMDLRVLNPFLEISEHKRFQTGLLHSATFDVHVISGKARGIVRASYKDLKLLSIDGRSGSESGVLNTIASFITNNIKLRTTNEPDELGSTKTGNVRYARAHDDAFFAFAWFALRSGVGEVVGF